MTYVHATQARGHGGPVAATTSSTDSSFARLRRGGSKVLRLLSPRSARTHRKQARPISPPDISFEEEHDSDDEPPSPYGKYLSSATSEKKMDGSVRKRNSSRSLQKQKLGEEALVRKETRSSIGVKAETSVHTPRRSVSKQVLPPNLWFLGGQVTANLDGASNAAPPSSQLPKRNPTARKAPVESKTRAIRRIVSSPEIRFPQRKANNQSTVVRRPEAARHLHIVAVKHIPLVRQPRTQATIHPLLVTTSPAPLSVAASLSPATTVDSTWSPFDERSGTDQTSLQSDGTRSFATNAVNVAMDCYAMPSVRFDLPPIREVHTPGPEDKQALLSPRPMTPLMRSLALVHGLSDSQARAAPVAEHCAAAQIFFDTFYESIEKSASMSPRSVRRSNMENSLSFICSSEEQQVKFRRLFDKLESDNLRALRCMKARRHKMIAGISMAGYEMIRVLGKGSFGIVSLVREKEDKEEWPRPRARSRKRGTVYAMKVIKKSEMLRQCQEAHLRIERDFMVKSARSSWIVPLIASFQDIDHLYLVMEFQLGGDFLNYLMTADHGIIGEDATRFYVAEIIACVEEAHNMRIIHRDIKPDNFLISASGHLKLSDFGLAFDGHWSHKQSYFTAHRYKMAEVLGIDPMGDDEDQRESWRSFPKPSLDGQVWYTSTPSSQSRDYETRKDRRRMARSIVGTSQYMAPEVIAGEHYDARCDWWSVGIILFECLFGFTPFVKEDRQKTKDAILEFSRNFPYDVYRSGPQPVSSQARHLIHCLLTVREDRLCSQKYWINDHKKGSAGTLQRVNDFDRASKDYRGRYVFSNDAESLKEHPFFEGINWRMLHHTTPPFKPRCGQEECRYFDTEEEILRDYMSDTMSASEAKELLVKEINGLDGEHTRKRPKQPAKRARDKLLRDPVIGKAVLQERKKTAFLGYTYRRPKTWSLGDEVRLWADQPTAWQKNEYDAALQCPAPSMA